MRKVLAIACNSVYFNACITLIASVHSLCPDVVDQILIYNLGLQEKEKCFLRCLQKVKLMEFELDDTFFPEYLVPKQFAWKPYVIKDAGRFGDLVLYMDAGAVLTKDVQCIFDRIESEDIFLVGDEHLNKTYTHDKCFQIMNATEAEKNSKQIWAGLQGYKVNGKYQQNYIDEAYKFSKIQEAVFGNHSCHRHDQSIYSVLCARNNIQTQNIYVFGEWRGINLRPEQVVYAHRSHYTNFEGLKFRTPNDLTD